MAYARGVEPQAAELVDAAHRARTFVEYERDALALIRGVIRADAAFIVRAHGLGLGAYGVRSEIVHACRHRWPVYGEELSAVFDVARRMGGVTVDVDVLGDDLRKTRVFREFIGPHDGRCTLVGILAFGGDVFGTIALGRRRGGYGAAERERLAALLPALSVCEAAMQRRDEAWATLTEREREVVRGLRLGYTNGEIAVSLGTSVNTVRNQMRSVFRKLGATTRAEAVALSLGYGA
jgi:DNA-binding CsgD family transcriptional regulator